MKPSDKIFIASINGTWGEDPEKTYFSEPKFTKQEAYFDLMRTCHNNAIAADFSKVAIATYEITSTVVINPRHEFPIISHVCETVMADKAVQPIG